MPFSRSAASTVQVHSRRLGSARSSRLRTPVMRDTHDDEPTRRGTRRRAPGRRPARSQHDPGGRTRTGWRSAAAGELLGDLDRVQVVATAPDHQGGAVTSARPHGRVPAPARAGRPGRRQPVAHQLSSRCRRYDQTGRGIAHRRGRLREITSATARRRPTPPPPAVGDAAASATSAGAGRAPPAGRTPPGRTGRVVGEQPAQRTGAHAGAERTGGAEQVGHARRSRARSRYVQRPPGAAERPCPRKWKKTWRPVTPLPKRPGVGDAVPRPWANTVTGSPYRCERFQFDAVRRGDKFGRGRRQRRPAGLRARLTGGRYRSGRPSGGGGQRKSITRTRRLLPRHAGRAGRPAGTPPRW